DGAGMSAASVAKRRTPDLEIVAFERGAHTSYGACGIPYYVGGTIESADDLVARTPEAHRRNGIDARIRTEVVAIDLAARRLTVRDTITREETTEPFDQLVIATGAVATPPPIPGAEAAEPARTIETAERLRSDLQTRGGDRAVVIGAGYIGLEMAENLVHRGLRDVTLIDHSPQVMNTLDADMALHVQEAAEGEGIRVLLNVDIEEVTVEGGRANGVRTSEGLLEADHVLIGTGAKPDVDVARAAGVRIGEDTGAIVVDDHMRVPDHDGVYAAGDCVESHHRILNRPANIQLGTHANQQGRIAGINATGGDLAFPGVLGTAISRICRYEISRTGISEREAQDAGIDYVTRTIEHRTRAGYYPGGGPVWVKLLAEPGTGKLLGGQIVGAQGAGKRIDTVATALWSGMTVAALQFADLAYAPPMSPTLDPVIVAARALAGAI
ncbi:MAG: FAD-dependent oxidoreductase, partial [Solirubrobacteraceae bacterium]|nr:FAD-dependent oxidoreductase [Solirubrobacteraceae bacterium]